MRTHANAMAHRAHRHLANLQVASANLTASTSRISDVDLAAELSTVSRTKILSRVGTVVLSRANAIPQRVLLLLE